MYTNLSQPSPRPAGAHMPGGAAAGLALGGLLLLLAYAIEIAFGMRYGRLYGPGDAPGSALARAGFAAFTLGLLGVGAGLFGLGWGVRPRAPIPAAAGMALAAVAFVLMPLNLAFLLGVFGAPRHVPALTAPVLTNLAATIVLSLTILRRRLLPARAGIALLAAGIITFPFILLTIPLEAAMPDYLIADLPFAAWGATLLAVSWLIRRGG